MTELLTDQKIRDILAQAGLGDVRSVHKVNVGFSHDVYSVDDRYILKVCGSEDDEVSFRKDIYLCRLLHDRIPTPEIIFADTSKAVVDRFFMVYHRIPGHNLYNRWHLLDVSGRRRIVHEICGILRLINETPCEEFAAEFGIDTSLSWHDIILGRINEWMTKVAERGLLEPHLLDGTHEYLERNSDVLLEQRIALTYHDPHFDNILISDDGHVTGILDFERTDIASVDFVLDLVRRMVRRPGKYASEESERFTTAEDYSELLLWYEEFYPELFDFADLETRLDIYTVEHSLAEVWWYPEGHAARDELRRIVG